MKSEVIFVIAVLFLICGWIGVSMKWQYDSDMQDKAFIEQLNSEKCKLVEVIAASSAFGSPQYKYQCTEKTYILNVDVTDVLTNK